MKRIIKTFSLCIAIVFISCGEHTQVSVKELKRVGGISYFEEIPFTGAAISKYSDGSKQKYVEFVSGKNHGEITAWYPDGKKKETGRAKEGKKIGVHQGFWPDGSHRYKKIYSSNGLMHGQQKQWHMNGTLARLSNYNLGREDGLQKGWRENGELRYNYQIVDNKRYGFMGAKVCVLPSI